MKIILNFENFFLNNNFFILTKQSLTVQNRLLQGNTLKSHFLPRGRSLSSCNARPFLLHNPFSLSLSLLLVCCLFLSVPAHFFYFNFEFIDGLYVLPIWITFIRFGIYLDFGLMGLEDTEYGEIGRGFFFGGLRLS